LKLLEVVDLSHTKSGCIYDHDAIRELAATIVYPLHNQPLN
jgi:hypothetical protein